MIIVKCPYCKREYEIEGNVMITVCKCGESIEVNHKDWDKINN